MASKMVKHFIRLPRGYRNAEAASFLAQFDELSGSLWKDLDGIGAAELAWQPKRGMNTIGMLLAHMAIVEVFWVQRATTGYTDAELTRVLGIGGDDDGMPCPANAGPPRTLKGWTLADYRALEVKARAFAKRRAKALAAADMDRAFRADRRDGLRRSINVRWVFYHLLEHYAGHYGQILLLRHQYRERRRKA